MNIPEKVEILFWHDSEEALKGDYSQIEILFDGKSVVTLEYCYHDQGADLADGFLRGVAFCLGVVELPIAEHRDVIRSE